MRRQPGKWWGRLTAFWDCLCAAYEGGLLWLLRQREALGLRGRTRKGPRRQRFRPSLETLEDVLAPGNLLSTASAFGMEAPPNADVPPTSSTPAPPAPATSAAGEEHSGEGANPAPEADTPNSAKPKTRSPGEGTDSRDGGEGTPLQEAPRQPALRGDGLGDRLRVSPMGEDPLHDPTEDEDVLPPTREVSHGDGTGSSSGSHAAAAAASGPGGSSGAGGAGTGSSNAAASQPAPLPSSAAQQAQTRLAASIQTAQAGPANAAAVPATPAAPAVSAPMVSAALPAAAAPAASPAPASAAPAANSAPAGQPAASGSGSVTSASPGGSGGLTAIDPNVSATEGQSYSGVVAEFTDADGNTNPQVYNTSVDFGDGTQAVPGMVTYAGGVFSVTATHTYTEEGSFTVATTVTDTADNSQTTVDSPATVADAALSGGGMPFSATPGQPFTATVARFQDADPAGAAGDYQATITWGDNTPPRSGTVTAGGGFFQVNGTHTYAAAGSYSVLITVTDQGGATLNLSTTATVDPGAGGSLSWANNNPSFSWMVNNTNATPAISPVADQNSTEGDLVSLPISASDTDGDTLTYAAVNLPDGLSINSTNGLISGTVAYTAAESSNGVYPVTVLVADSHGASSTASFTYTVADSNVVPTLTQPVNQTNVPGDRVSLQLQASDPNGDQLLYSATGLPPGLTIDEVTGEIYGTLDPRADFSSPYTVSVTAANQTRSASQTFTWAVNEPAQAPVLPSLSDLDNAAGDSAAVSIAATSANGDPVSYTVTGLPPGISLDPVDAQLVGTIDSSAALDTPYTVTVQASNGAAASSATFKWTIHPISVSPLDDQTNVNGDAVSLQVSATDAENRTLIYSASGLPPGLSIDAGSGLISGTLATTADTGSPYTTTVTATAGTDSASQSLAWTVSHLSLAPLSDRSDVEGISVSVQPSATDADADSLTYSATGLPPGVTIDPGTGLISGTLSATASLGGPYAVTVTAGDAGGNSASQGFTWAVTPHLLLATPGTQTNAPGDVVSLPVMAMDVSGQPTYSATGLPPGLGIDPASGLISGTLSAAASGSPYSVTLTATDGSGYSSSQTFAWDVSHVVLTAPGDQDNRAGDTVSLPLAGRDSDASALTWSAAELPAGLSIDPGTGTITGTITGGSDEGSPYAVTVTASENGYSASETFTWTIGAAVVFDAPGDQSDVGGDAVSLAISATDNQNGTLAYSATGLPAGLSIDPATGIISGTIDPSAVSSTPYDVIVSAADGSYSDSTEFNWTVSPLGLSNPGPLTTVGGSAVSLSLQAADAAGATLTYSALNLPPGLSINSSTGLISGTVPTSAAGNRYPTTVSVSDGSNTVSQSFEWEVAALALTNPGDQTTTEGLPASLALSAQDANGLPLSWSAVNLPAGLSIDPSSGVISGTTPVGQGNTDSSSDQVTVTVSDGQVSTSQTFAWGVLAVAALDNPGAQANAEGDAVSLQLNGNGDGVTFSATGLPAGLSLDPDSGLISGSLDYGGAEVNGGSYSVTATAQDDLGNSVSQTFAWTVADAHFAAQGVDVSATEGTDAAAPVASFSVDDTGLTAGAFTATIDWGDGTATTAGSISGSSGAFTVSGDHTYTVAGVYTVTTTITGPDGTLAPTSTAVVDDAALAGSGIDVSATEGGMLANVTVASFTDPAALDDVSGDSATIDWGDGGTSTGYVSVSGNTVYVSGSHSYAQAGSYSITTTLQSGGGDSETVTSVASVADAALTAGNPLTLSAVEGQAASLTLADFSDPNANALNGDFQVSIDWGDNTGPDSADAVNGSPSQFSVVGSHTYAESGTYTATVTITDDAGATLTAQATVQVADAPITAGGVSFSTLVGQPLGPEPVATFFDANPAAQASDFTVSIDYGDGGSSPFGVVEGQGGEFAVYDDYVYHQAGSYAVTVTILEDGQAVATAASTATVGTLQEGQDATLTVMSFTDSNPEAPSSYAAQIDWGDGNVTAGTVQGGGGMYSVQGDHSYASAGSYTVTVTVTRDSSDTISATSSVLVADAPLTLLANNLNTTEGQTLTNVPVAIFVDANSGASPTEFDPTILYGDGTPAGTGTLVATGPIYTVLASHSYANAGSYATEVTVGQGQAKGVANGEGTTLVKPNWKNQNKYNFTLDVALTGRLEDNLPGDISNGAEEYLPGQFGTRPVLQSPWWQGGQFQPQQVNLYLAGLGHNLAQAAGVARVTFQIAYGWTGHGPGFLVSSLPGFAGNATALAIFKEGTAADYSFDPTVDSMQAAPATVVIGKKATTAPMYVKDYGGEATLLATLWDKSNKVLHVFTQTVPVDPYHTGIALNWLRGQFNAWGSVPDEVLTNPNWDEAPFPDTFNDEPTDNSPNTFPTLRTLEKGDGLPLWYKYRGVLVDGGGFDPQGKNPQKGFVRLSAAVKNVLVEVNPVANVLQANKTGMPNKLDLWAALDMVSKAYSQAWYGAGVRLYYRFNPEGPLTNFPLYRPLGGNPTQARDDFLKNLATVVQKVRVPYLHAPIHRFWRSLTIAMNFIVPGLMNWQQTQLADLLMSGFSNSASSSDGRGGGVNLRAGSFLFYQDAQRAFRGLQRLRGAQVRNFDTFAAGVIIHELAHQLTQGGGHYADSTGDGDANKTDDFASVQFDYTQRPLPAGYVFQDYYPLPGTTFQFGHAWKSAIVAPLGGLQPLGTVITNMRLKNSFLPDP